MTNKEIVLLIFKDYATKNITDLLSHLDDNITWLEPGAPAVPYGGVYKGKQGILEMFAKEASMLEVQSFEPLQFLETDNLVAVVGRDSALVKSTGKVYHTEWVMLFTFTGSLVSKVQVYMDTNAIADAFEGHSVAR